MRVPAKCSTLTREQLLRLAKELNVPRAASLNKAELCAIIEKSRAKKLGQMIALASLGVGSLSVGAVAAARRHAFDVAPCAKRDATPAADLSHLAVSSRTSVAHVIVGGGPVGMFLALQLVYNSPWADYGVKNRGGAEGIIVLEKRGGMFSRRQVVVITRKSISQLPGTAQTQILAAACEVLPPAYAERAQCRRTNEFYNGRSLISIKLSELERALHDECRRVPQLIRIAYNVEDIQFVSATRLHFRQSQALGVKHEVTFRTLTGADGGSSVVREHVMRLPLRSGISDQSQQYGIVIMFDDKSGQKHVSTEGRSDVRLIAQHNSRAFWTRDGMAYIGLRVNEQFGRAVARELKMMPAAAITSWADIVALPAVSSALRYAKKSVCEYLEPQCPATFTHFNMSAFPLHVCRVMLHPDDLARKPPVFIVGDAVYQTHFFSGTGLLAGFEMVDAVAGDIDEIAVTDTPQKRQQLTHRVHSKIQAIVNQYVADTEVIARTKPMEMTGI